MSLAIQIDVRDQASALLKSLPETLSPSNLGPKIGTGVKVLFQKHFLSLGTNKRGWPSTHFYADAVRSTQYQVVPDGVMVSVNKIGIRQRVQGGEIRPVNASMLSIPISPVAYGHLPSEFPGLFLMATSKGAYLVQRGETISEKTGKTVGIRRGGGNERRRRRASLNFLFKLVASVNQKADPSVVPSREEIAATALQEIRSAIARALQRGGQS